MLLAGRHVDDGACGFLEPERPAVRGAGVVPLLDQRSVRRVEVGNQPIPQAGRPAEHHRQRPIDGGIPEQLVGELVDGRARDTTTNSGQNRCSVSGGRRIARRVGGKHREVHGAVAAEPRNDSRRAGHRHIAPKARVRQVLDHAYPVSCVGFVREGDAKA